MAALQLCLDRGQQLDWFASWEVCIEAGIAVAALWAFGVHVVTSDGALVDKRMLTDRNVMTGFLFITLVGLLLVGTTALLPTMLQNLFGYSVIGSGVLQMPRGIGMMMAMMAAGQIVGKVDARILLGCGMAMTATAMWMMTQFSPIMDATPFIISGFLQGAGLGHDLRAAQHPRLHDAAARPAHRCGGLLHAAAEPRRLDRHQPDGGHPRPPGAGVARRSGRRGDALQRCPGPMPISPGCSMPMPSSPCSMAR